MFNLVKKLISLNPASKLLEVKHLHLASVSGQEATQQKLSTIEKQASPSKVINPLKYQNYFQTNELIDLEELFK